MRLSFLTTVLLAACLASRIADACIIVTPQVPLPGMRPAPRNAHVWLQGVPMPLMGGATFALVRTDARSTPLPITLRDWEESSSLFELVPQAPLAADARYEVWGFPRLRRAPVLVSTFRTNDVLDVTAPSPPTLKRAERYPAAMGCPASLALIGSEGKDVEGDVLHAVWLGESERRIDYDGPPKALFVWPRQGAAELLHGSQEMLTAQKIGVRTIDLAGHLSAPVEIAITKP